MLSAKLVVVGGDAKRTEVNLKLPTIIGRGREGVTLTLPHKLVSRQHTEIFEREGGLFVKDLGSLNGTFVNNERIEGERPLKPNELLTLGNVTFRAVYLPVEADHPAPIFEEVTPPSVASNFQGPSSDVIDDYLSDDPASGSSTDNSLLTSAAAEAAQAAEAQAKSQAAAPRQEHIRQEHVRQPSKPQASAQSVAASATDEETSSIFSGDEIEGLSPEKSISMSAIDGLPTADNVSFKSSGLDLGDDVQPKPVVDQVEIELDEPPKTHEAPLADNAKLGSFLKKMPR